MTAMEFLQVLPVHRCKQYVSDCCDLINSEWPRTKAARLQMLFMSCDIFPTSLVLILNEEQVVGHCKLGEIRFGGDEIIIETVVIHPDHRGKGWGRILMEDAEEYARRKGKKKIYLSTRNQEGFYKRLGYEICKPILYFGFCDRTPEPLEDNGISNGDTKHSENIPPPPPPPQSQPKKPITQQKKNRPVVYKTFMCKTIV
ncbi:hypothetical protein AAG570_012175 [Ranatra chinensis]|uniref:N-acetyltransferase domain-containing protein n=1 Tax=Ranatra chinensis TaxID=642074 RepID=A0ABD0Z6C7_9HEMI